MNVFVDTSCLIQKGMLFDCKEDLQSAVKKFCKIKYYKIVVVVGISDWRLCGSRCKNHGMFEITRLEGEHSCLYPHLTQDHSQLDFNFMNVEIQNMIKVDPSVIVPLLQEIIKQ
ncbi:hypothetical protein IC582_003721 [Cucumis melo]